MTKNALLNQREIDKVAKEYYERSFAAFIAAAWGEIDPEPFVNNWHIKVLADHLQDVYEVGGQRLLINICPGSGKSKIVDVLFPAWVWARDPSKRIISAAHNEELAIRDASEHRNLVKTSWYQRYWPIEFVQDSDGKSNFSNMAKGFRKAHPISAMTGSRGNIVIVDDPHSVKTSESTVIRKGTVENFFRSVMNRLNNPKKDSIIVVMQRLHEEDLSGEILSKKALKFDHLCIPLFADGEVRKPTRIGWVDHREEGENMFPERYTDEQIAIYREALGVFGFAGQYQQRPVPLDDGFFVESWFNRFEPHELPKNLHYYMTSDHAPSGRGDYNVFRMWGVDEGRNIWMVDSFRDRCTMDVAIGMTRDPETGKPMIGETGALAMIKKWNPMGWYPENDNTWSAISSMVNAAMLETDTFCRIIPLATRGSGDKVAKATSYQAMASMGRVYLPVGAVGDGALTEYLTFPHGKHDDQVDADSAMARVIAEALPAFIPVVKHKPAKDEYYVPSLPDASDACWG
ncbi:hypothetical protein ASG11_17790 [Sphingomonas sp. Leaf357]|uniref:hypothetical protein n=1 Tax=Sphingomonas sp. Leaf357 TaxID=1736350 RepID=UPI0006F94616|nr:hypothetical protein [Sphingomonas sp. Leaf357]KQS01506.1 hypothetical protein ASG11_17790 [Sphingomonas sp. Leaf357]